MQTIVTITVIEHELQKMIRKCIQIVNSNEPSEKANPTMLRK